MIHTSARNQWSGGRETPEARRRKLWRMRPTLLVLEERTLLRELPGYGAYMTQVKYRLIPYVW